MKNQAVNNTEHKKNSSVNLLMKIINLKGLKFFFIIIFIIAILLAVYVWNIPVQVVAKNSIAVFFTGLIIYFADHFINPSEKIPLRKKKF